MISSSSEPVRAFDKTKMKLAILLVVIMVLSLLAPLTGIIAAHAYAADPTWEPGPRERIVFTSNELRDALLSNAVDKIYLGADITYATAMPTLAGGAARPAVIIDGTNPRTDTKHSLTTTVSFRLGTASSRVANITFQNIKLSQPSGTNGFISCANTTAALGTTITFDNVSIRTYRTVLQPGANGTNNCNVNFKYCDITSTNAGATGTRMICGRYIEFDGNSTIDSYSGTSQGMFSVANQVSTSFGSSFTVKKGASLVIVNYASSLQAPLFYNLRGLDLKVEENAIFFVVAGNLGYTIAATDTTNSFEVDKNAICIMNLRGNRSRLRSQNLTVNDGGILHLWASDSIATTNRMAVDAQKMNFNSPFQVVLATAGTTNNSLIRPSAILDAKRIKSIRYFTSGANTFSGYETTFIGALRTDYRNWWFQQNGSFDIFASNLGNQNSISISTNYDPSGNTIPAATPMFTAANFNTTAIHCFQFDGGSRAPAINEVFVGANAVTGTGQPGAYVTVTWPAADGIVSATPTTTVMVQAVPGLPIGVWRAEVPEDLFLNISDTREETQIKATQRETHLGLDRGESYAVYEPVQGTAMKLIGSNTRTIYYDSGTIPDKAEILFYGAGTNIELEEGKGRYILTNTAVANPGNIEAFEALWEATANPAHKGYIEPNNSAFWRSELCDIPANCTLWALAEVKMGGSATSSIVHDTLVYNNLFERKRISFRLLEGLYTDPAGSHTEISPYTEIPGNYGIPRNLSGGVHTGLLVRYNSVNIGLNSYMNDYWTAKTKNGADAPVTVSLGPGFPAAYLDLSDDGEGLLYTLYINNTEQKKLGLWELVPMAYVDKAGKPIPDSGGEPAMIWVPMDILEDDKEYGDDEEPDPPKPDVTSSDFLLRGGHYIPLKHHPYTPVGYYVSQYSLDVRDEPPGDPAKLNLCGDFSKDFYPEITDINFTPPERFYIVFAEGVTEIREIHLDQDEPDGPIIYPDIKTVANIEFAKPPVRYTAPKVADYVPVGWEIRNLKDDYEGKFVYGSDPEHFPTMDQNGLIFADISAEMISVGFGPLKPEELEIHWLYAKDLNNNGIPDDQEVVVNAFWNGIHPGFDFAVPLNRTITATRFGYDFTLTNDGSKDGNPEHIIELDSGAAQSSWLFDPKFPDNEAKVTIKPPDSTMQTVIFWYSLTSEEDDGFITVTVAGKTADSGLYSYPKRIAKKDLPYTLIDGIDLFAIPGYVLSPGQNHQVTGEGTYTFIYVSTEGTVKITLQEEGSGEILGFFYEPAKVGEPFSYNAPDLSGYKLVSPGSIGIIDNVLPGGASEIVFKYAKITSPVTIVYKEDISGRVIRVIEVIPPVVGEGNIVLTPDLDAPEFYTAKQLSVTYDYDGDNPVEVEAFYSKDLVNIPIMAVDHFTDATDPPLGTQSPFLNQRKGEITTVTAPAIVGYTLVGSNTRQVIALGNPETFRYRSASDIVGVTVNVYAGSKTGPIIQSIVILADVGETITVDPTSIKLAGYMYNASHTDNRLSWRFGDPDSGDGTDIRVIMIDIRAALNVYTKLGTAAATLHQSELLVTPYTKTVYAPNINGWAVTGYQLGDGTPVTTGTVSQVTLTDITASITNVTFLYQEIAEKYVTVTIKGVTGSSDLFIYNRLFEISDLPYTLVDGVDIPITVGDLILDPGQDHEIPGPGTYTFTYSLSAEHNSSLSTLSVSEGVLSPVFAPGTLSYTVNVAGIEEITIAATAAGTVSGAGTFELEVGENLFDIVVTAPCGESEHKTTYTVKVILAEPGYHDSSLSSLSVSEGLLNPVFTPETLSYTVNVSGIDEITISATGAGAISGTGTFELELGENLFDIVVTALCGESEHTTTYTVRVVLSEPELEPLVIIGGNTLLTGWPVNGTTIDIPIKFSIEGDFDQVLSAGHSFKLTYDPTMLEFSGPVIYNDPDGAYFILINQNPLDPLGTLTVVCSANYPKSIDLTGSHQITIPFKVIGDPARNDTTNLVSSDPKVMREDPLDGNYLVDQKDVTVIFGGGSARIKGDINNDGVVTPEDAMLLLQWLVGLPTPGVIWDAETLWAANIKGYGDPDPSDAALILRIITGG